VINILNSILLIVGVLLIIVVILQPAKTENAAGSMSGSGVQVFAQSKERGAELVFKRMTVILGTLLLAIPVIIALLSK
jgi:preprotein translocase subunit SecG